MMKCNIEFTAKTKDFRKVNLKLPPKYFRKLNLNFPPKDPSDDMLETSTMLVLSRLTAGDKLYVRLNLQDGVNGKSYLKASNNREIQFTGRKISYDLVFKLSNFHNQQQCDQIRRNFAPLLKHLGHFEIIH